MFTSNIQWDGYGTMSEGVEHPQKRQRTSAESFPLSEVCTLRRQKMFDRGYASCVGGISQGKMAMRESAEWVSTVIEMAHSASDPVAGCRAIVEFASRTKNIIALTGEKALDQLPTQVLEELKQESYPRGVYFQFSDLPAAKLLEGVKYPRYIKPS